MHKTYKNLLGGYVAGNRTPLMELSEYLNSLIVNSVDTHKVATEEHILIYILHRRLQANFIMSKLQSQQICTPTCETPFI